MSRLSRVLPLLVVLGCGGGDPPENQPPIANAGADRSVAEGMTATLDGAGSSDADGMVVSYVWTQLSGPSVTLLDADTAHARFVAPLVDVPTVLEMQLDVTDEDGLTAYDTVVLTIDEVDTTPDPFSFVDVTDVVADSLVVSAPVILTGFNTQLPISVVGGSYAIDAEAPEAFTTSAGIVQATDVIRVRTNAAASGSTSVTVTVGTESAVWNVTTAAPPNAPSATLYFPVGSAEIPSDTIRVRGHASAVPGRTVTGVTIGVGALSVATALDSDGTFRADVPLAHGDNSLVVHVYDDTGGVNDAAALTQVRRAHPIRVPTVIAWDAARSRLVAMDNIYDAAYWQKASTLVALDLATNATTVVSGPTRGTGPVWKTASDIVIVGNTAYVLDTSTPSVLAVDLISGDRTVLASAAVGTGPLGSMRKLAYDATRNRLIFTAQGDTASVVAIALVNGGGLVRGDRTVLAASSPSAMVGSGTAMSSASQIAVRGDAAFVYETAASRIARVDLVSLVRSVVSVSGDGKGVNFGLSGGTSIMGGFAFDASGLLYASDYYADSIIAIDVTTGVRTPVSNATLGGGPSLSTLEELVHGAIAGELIVADRDSGRLLAVRIDTGERRVLHESAPVGGQGIGIYIPTALTMSPDGAHAFVADYVLGRVYRVTLATGAVTLVTENTGAFQGPVLDHPVDIRYDAPRDRLLLLDGGLVALDPVSGARTLVSGTRGMQTTGTGDPFTLTKSFDVDEASGTAYVADTIFMSGYKPQVFSVSLTNGDRSTIYDGSLTAMDLIYDPEGLAVDRTRNLAFALDSVSDVLWTIDLSAGGLGNRAQFSSGDDPADGADAVIATGPDFEYPSMLVLDTERGELYLWDDVSMRLFGIDDHTGNRVVRCANDVGRGIALAIPATYTPLGGSENAWDMIGIAAGPTPGTIVGASNMHNGVLVIDVESGDRVRVTP